MTAIVPGDLSDLEITKACAVAMGLLTYKPMGAYPYVEHPTHYDRDTSDPKTGKSLKAYNPLTDDAQCFALLKKFKLHPIYDDEQDRWDCFASGAIFGCNADLNRCICECVAKMHLQR